MKNIACVFVVGILLIHPMKSIAQNNSPLNSYSYFDKKLYDLSDKRIPYAGFYDSLTQDSLDISLTLHANKIYTMWIKAVPQDTLNLYGGILISEGVHYEFVDALKRAKTEYEDLSKWAKTKDIAKYVKILNISFDAGAFYFIGKRWQTEMKVPLDFKFIVQNINDSLRYLLVIQTNHINQSLNGSGNLNGYSLFFQSSQEIENFIQMISTSKVNNFVAHEKNKNYRKEEFVFSKDSLRAYEKRKSQEYAQSFVTKHPFFKHFSWGIQIGANYEFATEGMFEKVKYVSPGYYIYSPKINIPVGVYGNYSFGRCFVRSSLSISMTKLFESITKSFDPSRQEVYVDDNHGFISKLIENFTFDIPMLFGLDVLNLSKSRLKAKILIGPDMRFFGDVLKVDYLTKKTIYGRDDKMILGARGGLLFEYKLFELGVNYNYFPEGNKLSGYEGIYRCPMSSLNMTLGLRIYPK